MSAIATYNFAGKTILITGGAGDIGRATAQRFVASGAAVALLDLHEDRLADAAQALSELGGTVITQCCDVTHLDAVTDAVAQVVERQGRIDYVFNNAGFQGAFAQTDQYPVEEFRRVVEVNILGVFYGLRTAAQHMKARGGGAIVNMASHAGVVGPPNMLAYAASKFAVIGMTQTAARDLAPYGIRVNALSPALIGPGLMWTRQTELQAAVGSPYFEADPKRVEQQMIQSVPLRRLGRLAEVAQGVAFLMSDESSYITGFNLEVTGGI